MKTLLLALGFLSLAATAHAEDPACNNRAATVIVAPGFGQKLIDYVMTIDSIPLGGRILYQTAEVETVQIQVFEDEPGVWDGFDVARVIKGIRETEKDGLGIRRIVADVCYDPKGDNGGRGDSGNVGTIGH